MPDNEVVWVDIERFQCPEVLFKPSLLRLHESGIHEKILDSIMKIDEKIRDNNFYSNIVLSGGTSMFGGLINRLEKELVNLAPVKAKIKIITPEKYSAWIGGSTLGSLTTFQDMWVSKAEYDEIGPEIINRKCF
jgi:actin-related protein